MMRRKENFRKIFLVFFCFLSLILSFGLVKTAHAADIDDGITNWQISKGNQIGNKKIGGNLSLGYAFGLAQNTSGMVSSMGDETITLDSIGQGSNSYYSKFNVFLNDNGKYISSVAQSGSKLPMDAATQNVSLTSLDFAIVPESDSSGPLAGVTNSVYSVLANKMTNKKFYYATDANGNDAYKLVGDFTRSSSGSNNPGTYTFQIELLLRVSPTNAPVIQREMYVKNTTDKTQSFGVLFGEDTALDKSGNSYGDLVSIKDLGDKSGMYIEDNNYKLLIDNQLQDGPTSYTAQEFTSGGMNWLKGFSPNNFAGNGAEANSIAGNDIIGKRVDSSYTQKWPYTTLAPGKTAHFATAIGVTKNPYSLPIPSKTYTNETRSTGVNKVGDKLKFNLKIKNDGIGSSWNFQRLEDKIPDGLEIDPNSIKITTPSSSNVTVDPSSYDNSTRTLTIAPTASITDSQSATVTFEATITQSASGSTLKNTANFTGVDTNTTEVSTPETYNASVDIPVEKSAFTYTFTNYVRNESTGETTFSNQTNAKAGDIIDFQTKFTVNADSKDTLATGGALKNPLPDGLKFKDGKITGSDNVSYGIKDVDSNNLGTIAAGLSVTMEYRATVTKSSAGIISNSAILTGTTSTGASTGDIVSNQADINISNVVGFTQTPSLIDFGAINFTGQAKTLTNIATTGQLIVNHPTDNNYSVSVAYNNDDSATQMKNSNGDTLSPSSDGLMFIRTRNSSPDDKGTWTPISPSGTPIQTGTFNGNQDLTNYIGVGDWKLNIASNTQPGLYNGTLTWSMADSIPNN